MNENGKKKREWVKTAAIIFLSVMLVLTFFSNTIMNYSLPEVATQYVESGTITAKIRGSGVVESGNPYNVEVTESRKVSQVAVKVGDQVEKDDVLLYLEDAESEELKTARDELDKAKRAYTDALLSTDITSADIQAADMGISEENYRNQITAAQNAVTAAENALTAAKREEKEAKKLVDELQNQYDAFTTQISITPENNADVTEETRTRDEAKAAWDNAAKAASDRQNELTAIKNEVAELESKIALVESQLPKPEPTASPEPNTDEDASQESDAVPKQTEEDGETDGSEAQKGLTTLSAEGNIAELEQELVRLNDLLRGATEREIAAQRAYNAANLEATKREDEYKRAEQRLEDKKNAGSTEAIIANLKKQQGVIEGQKKQAEIALAEKTSIVTERETALSDNPFPFLAICIVRPGES